MDFRWRVGEKSASSVQKRLFDQQSRLMSLGKRRDGVLLGLVLTTLLSAALLILIAVQIMQRDGYFELPLVGPLPDERLLVNIRNEQQQPEFLSAALHQGQVYISQKDGAIHRYDPQSGLWSTEFPFKDGSLADPNLVMLRSGCGTDPISDRITACPDNETLWAITAQQGLVRRLNGRWEILAGDSAFRGASGKPVNNDQLNSAAVSKDGKWLLVGSANDGVGLYNLETRSWVQLGADFFQKFPSQNITRVIWFLDAFWVGTDLGLVQASPAGEKLGAVRVTDLPLGVADLDVSPDNQLWVLGTLPCGNQSGLRCSWLGKFRSNEQFEVLLNELNRFPDLDLANLIDAQWWGDRVVMVGKSGIVTYDPGKHSWSQLYSEPVELTLDLIDQDGFYFTTAGKVGRVAPGEQVVLSDLIEGPTQQLAYGEDGRLLVLTVSGNVYAALPGGSVDPVFSGQETKLDPNSFKRAVSFGNQVVMIGEKGALVHDVRNRTYQDIQSGYLPGWFTNPENQFIAAGGYVFVLNGRTSVYVMTQDQLTSIDFYQSGDIAALTPILLADRAKSWWKWEDEGLGVLTEAGQVLLVKPSGVAEQTGITPTNLAPGPINDVAELPGQIAFATLEGLRLYNTNQHSWSQLTSLPDGQQPMELAKNGNQILAATNLGSLVQINGSSASFLIAKPYQLHINDQTLSDVLLDGKTLYMAGNGWVEVYDTEGRTIRNTFELNTAEPVRLLFVQDGKPVSLSGGKAFLGEQVIDAEAGATLGMTSDGTLLWTVREGSSGTYLKSYLLSDLLGDNSLCFFRTPLITDVNQVYDARQLLNGTVAVSTNSGLFFYSPAARSWVPAPVDTPSGPLRLYVTNKYLLLVSASLDGYGSRKVEMVSLDSISLPASCSQAAAAWVAETEIVRAVSVDEARGEMLTVSQDGAVMRWQDGNGSLIRVSTGDGPQMSELRRFYIQGNDWVFTSKNAIWFYDTILHQWKKTYISLPSDAFAVDINLEWPDNEMNVIAKDEQGSFYTAKFDPTAPTNLQLGLIYTPKQSSGNLDAPSLLDAQTYGNNLWGFLQKDRAMLYNPVERRWEDEFSFADSEPSRVWGRLLGVDIIQSNKGQRLWINKFSGPSLDFVPYDLQAAETTAFDTQRGIWRYTQDGNIFQCVIADVDYRCENALPPPFLLDPQNISLFFTSNAMHWFQFADSLRIYNPATYQEVFLPGHQDGFRDLNWIRRSDQGLFLFHPGELLYIPADKTDLNAVQAFVVEKVVYDSSQAIWARFKDGWKIFENGSFRVPEGDLAQVFVFEGSIPAGLDSQNVLYRWENGKFVSTKLALPQEISPDAIAGLIPHFNNSWWVLEQDRILFMRETFCQTQACLTIDKKSNLPAGLTFPDSSLVTGVRLISSGVELFLQDGRLISVKQLVDATLNISTSLGSPILAGTPVNEWPKFSALVAKLPNGRQAYDPAVELKVSADGKLLVRRISGEKILAERGALFSAFAQLPALDAGWVQWNRADKSFKVATSQGKISLRPDEFIQAGKLIFEPVEALLVIKGGQYLAANSSGTWLYRTTGLRVDDPTIQFTPVRLPGSISAAHGRFYSDSGELIAGQSQVNTSITPIGAMVGDVVIQEKPAAATVSIWLKDGENTFPAATDFGFLWDMNLRGIAYGSQTELIQSDAGIFTLTGYDLILPAGSALLSGRNLVSEVGQAYLAGAEWLRLTGNNWLAQADPTTDRPLLDNPTWKWTMQNSQLRVELKNNPFQFQLVQGGGLGFSSDQVQAAGVSGGQILVLSGAFLEVTDIPDKLGSLSADRSSPFPADAFMQFHDAQGRLSLYSVQGNKVAVWDSAKGIFSAASFDPRVSGLLAAAPALQFTRSRDGVVKEVLAQDVSGSTRWTPFAFSQDRFPFDFILSVTTFENQVYLGTLAGLEIFNPGSPGLAAMQLVNIHKNVNGQLTAVTRVGSPLANPAVLMARTENNCMERASGANSFSPCAAPDAINTLFRLDNSFWRWSKNGGQATGFYRNAAGAVAGKAITAISAGFPHDQLAAAISCKQQIFSLWSNGWVSAYPKPDLSLQSGVLNYSALPLVPKGFTCLALPLDQNGVYLNPGLYAQSIDGMSFAYYQQKSWQAITGAQETAGLAEQVQMPSFYESARLRLKTSLAGALIFEYKTDQKNWLALPWLDGRVILDHWKRVLSFDGSLWAASPAGLVSFRTLPGGAAYLDPANFTLVQEPLVENVFCSVSDIKEINGAVWIRCNSNSSQVFSGRLTSGKDQANFSLNPTGDPFAAEALITKEESNLWRWDLKERANGSLGKIDVYLTGPNQKEELVGLFNGQWGFDAVESLTFHEQDWVEMAGQLAGWYRAPSSDLHLRNWLRQTDWPALLPASIAWVGSGKSKGEAIFCLRSNDGMYARVISDKLEQKISSCADFQADEGLWQYDLLEGNLEISGSERAIHDITRELRDGRFTDDIVVGLPIPVSEDAGVYYLLPTEAGILRFTQENARTDLIKLGKDKTEPEMTVLAQFPESGPVFYRSGQLFALEKPDEAPVLTLQLPDPEGVTAIEDGPLNYLRVWVTSAGGTSWFLVDPQTGLIAAEKVLPVMVEGFDVYRENVLRWGPSPYLQVQFYLGEISFLKTQAQPPINAKLGANFDLIIPISVGEQMVLVGKQNVLVSNLSRAMRELLK